MNQMPAHVHSMAITTTPKAYSDAGTSELPEAAMYALSGSGYAASGGTPMKSYTAQVQMSNTGSDYPFEILPPYMGLNYIICQYGVFPARN
jgi:microcystin-dependent protein